MNIDLETSEVLCLIAALDRATEETDDETWQDEMIALRDKLVAMFPIPSA